MSAIEVKNLTKRYDTVTALSDISFDVESGEIMGFLGPNGAGKTTTLRILTGMLNPTEGSVYIEGLNATEEALQVRRNIGYLPENVALYPEMRIQEYLSYRARLKGIPGKLRRRRIDAVLDQCELGEAKNRLVGRLSKGYRQRVGLADCLLAQPKTLILDEPTIGLDPHQIRQTRRLITSFTNTTVLLSTHILPEVEMTCKRVAIINKGCIAAIDAPGNLRAHLKGSSFIRAQLQGEPSAITSALTQIPNVIRAVCQEQNQGFSTFDIEASEGSDVREAIFRLALERNWTLRELSQSQASLEEVFIHLTTQEN